MSIYGLTVISILLTTLACVSGGHGENSSQILWMNSLGKLFEDGFDGADIRNDVGWDSIVQGVTASNTSLGCRKAVEKIFEEEGHKRNILVDASGKPSAGLLYGNLAWLGDYEQCVAETELHHCLLQLRIQYSKSGDSKKVKHKAVWGVCLPTECTSDDVDQTVEYFKVLIKISGIHCSSEVEKTPRKDSGFIATLVVVSMMCLLILCATLYDNYLLHRRESGKTRSHYASTASDEEKRPILGDTRYLQKEKKEEAKEELQSHMIQNKDRELSKGRRVFLCFSFDRCVSHIMATKPAPDDITCLHGIRTISMFWIILGHVCSFILKSETFGNPLRLFSVQGRWFTSQAILNTYSALDSFFLLGGLLSSYNGLKYMHRSSGKLNWFIVVSFRYLRITPAVALLILLYTFIYPYLGEGPLWYKRVADSKPCHDWWWTNFLYINNFFPENTSANGCVSWTWYLAVDMQLFLVSIPVIILLWRLPLLGVVTSVLLVIGGVIVRAVVYDMRNYAATEVVNNFNENGSQQMFMFNVKPYARAVPYFAGTLVGYLLFHQNKARKLRLHFVVVIMGWALAFAVGMSVVYGLYGVFDVPAPAVNMPSKAENVAFACLNALAWSVALTWVIVSCHHGYGGPVNRFLSWSIWVPLSRLTFCAYLLHPAIIYLYTGTLTAVINLNIISVSVLFAGLTTISYAAAFLLSVLVEVPFCKLPRVLITR